MTSRIRPELTRQGQAADGRGSDARRQVLRAVPLAVAAAVLWASAAPAQSLGDVARREAERRKAVKTPAKVYTNEDLTRLPKPHQLPPSPETPAGEAAKPPEQPKALKTAEEVKDEKYWRGRVQEVRSQLNRDQLLLDALQSRVNVLSSDFVNRDDPAQRALIAEDRQKALGELERTRQEIDRLKKQIADIDEEARKAGVPAGWLR